MTEMTIYFEDKLRRAEAGDRFAQQELGIDYYYGRDVETDYAKALHWFSLAAAQDLPESMTMLAWMYGKGKGVAVDMTEALRLYEQSAARGEFVAQISLAQIYRSGSGTPVNLAAAFRWYVAAVVQESQVKGRRDEEIQEAKDYIAKAADRVSHLEELLDDDPNDYIRMSAATVVGRNKIAGAIPALIRALSDPTERLRSYAAAALSMFDVWAGEADPYKDDIAQTLWKAMDDPSEEVREWATSSVIECRHNTPETRARLWRSLDDPNDHVRAVAAYGLAAFETPGLSERLDALLRDEASLSHGYFAAAETLGDAALLPALRLAAERVRASLNEGEEMPPEVNSAIESLETARRLGLA